MVGLDDRTLKMSSFAGDGIVLIILFLGSLATFKGHFNKVPRPCYAFPFYGDTMLTFCFDVGDRVFKTSRCDVSIFFYDSSWQSRGLSLWVPVRACESPKSVMRSPQRVL